MRKLLVLLFVLTTLPAIADDINMTPQNTYSGYYNRSTARPMYPHLNTPTDRRAEFMKPKSVTEMGNINLTNDAKSPMTYSQFPKNYDSSNMMIQQNLQNGMQNMFMGL